MNRQERYIFEKLSEVGRSNVPFVELAQALAQDPNIQVTVPKPVLEIGQVGIATPHTENRRVVGLVERNEYHHRHRFRYINVHGDAVHCSIPDDFEPVATFTKAELVDFRKMLIATSFPQQKLTDLLTGKGFPIDE